MKHYLAMDFGASSGRAMLGSFDGASLKLEQLHRFENGPVEGADGHLHWDADKLFAEICESLRLAAADGIRLESVGVDTWGVDYGLLDEQGKLLSQPFHYRDARTDDQMQRVFDVVPDAEVFGATGIQFMQLNTLFQLSAERESGNLERARKLLFMPDLFNYFLTGEARCERSIASTSQCYNPRTRSWASDVLAPLGLDKVPWAPFIEAGTVLGALRAEVAQATGAGPVPVVAVAGHDTASAVAAVPAKGTQWAYLSSGTWSLMGVERVAPLINDDSLHLNFTNETGFGQSIRFLKNISGLWTQQECRRVWAEAGRTFSWKELEAQAEASEPFRSVINPDDGAFLAPGDMPARIRSWCREQGQPEPQGEGAVIRAILEGLGLRYRWTMQRLESLCGQSLETVHVVGGGSCNDLLNRFTAAATGKPVEAGPEEATAIGNIIVQMIGLGDLPNLAEARTLVAASFPTRRYEPAGTEAWEAAGQRFAFLFEKG